MDTDKKAYVLSLQAAATDLAKALQHLSNLREIWDDRLYGPGLANEFTAEDFAVYDNMIGTVDPANLYAFVIAANQILKFVENDNTAVTGDHKATINKVRRDM